MRTQPESGGLARSGLTATASVLGGRAEFSSNHGTPPRPPSVTAPGYPRPLLEAVPPDAVRDPRMIPEPAGASVLALDHITSGGSAGEKDNERFGYPSCMGKQEAHGASSGAEDRGGGGVSLREFAADLRAGLSKPGQRELPSKYFYDEVGSALFEAISVLPEYGLTRADERIVRAHADEIVGRVPSPAIVAELGSGSGRKPRWVLGSLGRREPTVYYPIDISPAALARCEWELSRVPSVRIIGMLNPYLEGLQEVASRRKDGQRILVLFLGSTIGNFDRPVGEQFLGQVRSVLLPGDALLLGTDLEKPIPQMLAAYDDPIGVTAAFNINLLARINRQLGGDFDLRRWRHAVLWEERQRRIEMHLVSQERQTVRIPRAGLEVFFRKDETIWTENSHKYTPELVATMAQRAGFRCEAQWIDEEWPFAESLLIAVSPDSAR